MPSTLSLPDHLADIDTALSAACAVMLPCVDDLDCSRHERCSMEPGDVIEVPVNVAFTLRVTHAGELRGQLIGQCELLVAELKRGAL